MRKRCKVCKKHFITSKEFRTFCSLECKEQVERYKRLKKPRKKRCNMSIDEIVRNALSEGLSYGQYVAKYNLL